MSNASIISEAAGEDSKISPTQDARALVRYDLKAFFSGIRGIGIYIVIIADGHQLQ